MKPSRFFLFLTGILFLFGFSNPTEKPSLVPAPAAGRSRPPHPPQELPSFLIYDATGKKINLKSLKGKKLVVNLWATWCPPCRVEIPSLQKLQRATDPAKVAFVLLSLDNRFETALQFVRRKKIDLPVYYPAEPLPGLFNVPGIPMTFIFSETGELIRVIEGGENFNHSQYRRLLQ